MPDTSQIMTVVDKKEVELFAELFKHIDGEIYTLLRSAQIPNDILTSNDHYDYLPETTVKNVVKIMGESASREEFSLFMWSFCKQTYVPRFVAKLSQQDSLKSALDQFGEQLKLVSNGANVYTKQSGGKWWLVREKPFTNAPWFKFAELFSVIFINELLLVLTQGRWKPSEVGIQNGDLECFQSLPQMGSAQFYTHRPVTAFEIPEDIMLAPIVLPQIAQVPDLTKPLPSSFLSAFKLVIKPYLTMGKLPISLASEILNIHVRTIQRRLESEGVVYKTLIEEMVLEQVLELLKQSDLSITQVGAKMGYSDSSHFTRAFKRQMNMTPRQYRKEHS
ncbi:AraC family transcriptional regulator [Vibrio sp. 10N.222.54.B6]|nr:MULTISPECIES: helix-turn-helix transcriptional regulator [unclassified Vibrio]PMO00480.1 AraC family transcriptional regulator [Vibrio sp. 10N.222.55.F9]PMO00694.1 AraC family transcriptional regulator [Vibrio sp. 10N.222.55.C12]PMO12839.1 AraC family transcriptional regulator [Vibrio sp. 10N.222.54.F10]PMO20877.1 AraC family transcriptional regulator [Vibrio sp. 10N.222.54.B6]